MKKQIAATLLFLVMSVGISGAATCYTPGHHVTSYTPGHKVTSYTPGYKVTVHETSFAQQVRSVWERLFAWM